jgi:RNA polymerase sigma factor (sigma-70 family)
VSKRIDGDKLSCLVTQQPDARDAAGGGTDLFLAVEAAMGVSEAWEQIVHRHGAVVYTLIKRWGYRHDADDLCQDVFLLIWRRLAQYRGEASLKTWIYQITMNYLRNHATRVVPKRRAECSLEDEERKSDVLPLQTEGDAADVLLEAERRALVRRAVYELPELHREAIILRDLEGISYTEIAETLMISVGTAKSRVSRARQALVAALAQRGILE